MPVSCARGLAGMSVGLLFWIGGAALLRAQAPAKVLISSSMGATVAPEDVSDAPDGEARPDSKVGAGSGHVVRPTDMIVGAGETAPRQSGRDKVVGALRNTISPYGLVGDLISSGYSQAVDGRPQYGTDSGAFGERLGAAALRGATQTMFSAGALAVILREDPRYYVLGPSEPFGRRVLYSVTRPLVTRTDAGHRTPNFALLGGYLGAAALTPTYYPARNQGAGDVLVTFGASIGGAALGDAVHEFLPDVLRWTHLRRHR